MTDGHPLETNGQVDTCTKQQGQHNGTPDKAIDRIHELLKHRSLLLSFLVIKPVLLGE